MPCDSPTSSSFASKTTLRSRSRSTSLSVDHRRVTRTGVLAPPSVRPSPQYIAASPAAQLIAAANGINIFDSQYDNDGVVVTEASLGLLNGFLDHMLFNILLAAKSTKLVSIRPAVAEVLKPRLAKEVVSAADEELGEYMVGSEDEELSEFRGGQEPANQFELERSWKLIRLRCMVYTRLGDMEEDDEEDYLDQERLHENDGRSSRFSNNVGHITPAAAMFLTSILEYLGENALILAGENAANRMARGKPVCDDDDDDDGQESTDQGELLIVDDVDAEKIALNPTLGRLWRTWRKQVRVSILSRPLSRESLIRRGRQASGKPNSRRSSIGTVETFEEPLTHQVAPEPALSEGAESLEPAHIPLPLSKNDIDEIEVPNFTSKLAIAMPARSMRPRSLFLSGSDISSPTSTRSNSPKLKPAPQRSTNVSHSRSQSLPDSIFVTSAISPRAPSHTGSFTSSKEDHEHLETMPEGDEEPGNALHPAATDTMHGGARKGQRHDSFVSNVDETLDSVSSFHGESFDGSREDAPRSTDLSPTSPRISTQDDIIESAAAFATSSQIYANNLSRKTVQRSQGDEPSRSLSTPSKRTPSPENHTSSAPAQGSIVETAFVSHSSKPPSQPPRLTPLREMVAEASSTPDETSETAHHNKSADKSDQRPVSGESDSSLTPRSKSWNKARLSVNGGTTPRRVQSVAVSPGTERAAVQRVTPPPTTPRDSMAVKPRRSESIGSHREARPAPQVSSKLKKGLVGRQTADQPTSAPVSFEPIDAQDKGDEPANLDQLIKSEETIRYTLTPRNMREMEDPDSPRWSSVRANEEDSVALKPPTSREAKGLRILTSSGGNNEGPRVSSSSASRSNASPLTQNSASPSFKTSVQPSQARDARADMASVRDFADFIRSTGPNQIDTIHEKAQPPAGDISNRNNRFTKSLPNSPALGTPPASAASTPRKLLPKQPHARLEARSAVTPKEDRTSDLAEFLREGPPKQSPHRMPKTVAPLRTTKDSEELQQQDRDFAGKSSITSTRDGSVATKSVNSSFNSRTALLESSNASNNWNQNGRSPQHSKMAAFHKPQENDRVAPVRKQRRVKDPYAIDTDSEDDILDEPVKETQGGEESLADFLRNAAPPPAAKPPQPFSINVSQTDSQGVEKPKTKNSSLSMKSRIMRSTSSADRFPANKLSRSSLRSHKSTLISSSISTNPPPPPPKPYQPNSQQHNEYRSYRTHSIPSEPIALPRKNVRNMDPHAIDELDDEPPYSSKSETAALADFFKNTAPPPPTPPQKDNFNTNNSGFQDLNGSGSSSFAKVFMRKKKQYV